LKKIYIGADHAGFKLKEAIKKFLTSKKISFEDLGNREYDKKDDYPDFGFKVAERVAKENTLGILFCGSGQGVCIAANKVKGIRAVFVNNLKDAKSTREHNNANVLCLSGENTPTSKAKEIITTWLKTPASSEARHVRRVNKIKNYER